MTQEGQAQANLFQLCKHMSGKYPELKLLFHIPNGGSRNTYEARALKSQGVKSGVPDMFLPVSRGKFHGLFIELKVGKNKTSCNQDLWINELRSQGYAAEVCYGTQEAQLMLVSYLDLKK